MSVQVAYSGLVYVVGSYYCCDVRDSHGLSPPDEKKVWAMQQLMFCSELAERISMAAGATESYVLIRMARQPR
jgi:hypothetical protein